jgi:hypothetical protein
MGREYKLTLLNYSEMEEGAANAGSDHWRHTPPIVKNIETAP